MRLQYSSPLLCLLLLLGCSKTDQSTEIPEGRLELVWAVQPEGAEDEELEEPWFADIGGARVQGDFIYVPDWMRNTIVVLDHSGAFVRTIGREGPGPGEFGEGPSGITISSKGTIYGHLGWGGTHNKFSLEGEFLAEVDHRQYFAGTPINILSPVFTDDLDFIYYCAPSSFPRRYPEEDQFNTPLFLQIRGSEWETFYERWISEEEDRRRKDIVQESDFPLVREFTGGMRCKGISLGEIIFIKACDPYTIHSLEKGQPRTSFQYLEIDRKEWTIEYEMKRGDRLTESPYRTAGRLTPIRDGVQKHFAWTHRLTNLVRSGNDLCVIIELQGENVTQLTLYVIDLVSQQLRLTIPIEWPAESRVYLSDSFDDGTLLFTVFEPIPGIQTYRIVEPS